MVGFDSGVAAAEVVATMAGATLGCGSELSVLVAAALNEEVVGGFLSIDPESGCFALAREAFILEEESDAVGVSGGAGGISESRLGAAALAAVGAVLPDDGVTVGMITLARAGEIVNGAESESGKGADPVTSADAGNPG